MDPRGRDTPYAITMWDFSWLERRYPGGGYADWDCVLDELTDRGYDAVRIDAYPHLLSRDPEREWTLPPAFEACDWGAPDTCRVTVGPALVDFVEKCADRDVAVALSSWFREDATDARMDVETPSDLAAVWVDTLDYLADAGLLETVCWVDLCNEFPLPVYAPFFSDADVENTPGRDSPAARRWINGAIEGVRDAYPDQAYCLSETAGPGTPWGREMVDVMDLQDLHLWLMNTTSYLDWEDLDHGLDSDAHYEWVRDHGQPRYREDPEGWKAALATQIDAAAAWSRRNDRPLAITESWGPIHFKDWPGLEWDWVKDICAFGTRRAAATGRWLAISTSNFCGPQFRGMWNDTEWHRDLTATIHTATVEA